MFLFSPLELTVRKFVQLSNGDDVTLNEKKNDALVPG